MNFVGSGRKAKFVRKFASLFDLVRLSVILGDAFNTSIDTSRCGHIVIGTDREIVCLLIVSLVITITLFYLSGRLDAANVSLFADASINEAFIGLIS